MYTPNAVTTWNLSEKKVKNPLNLLHSDYWGWKQKINIMKKILFILLSVFLFSCQKEDDIINSSEKLISQKEYVTMLKDINTQYEQILNESKPKNLSISEYKKALVTGKIELTLGQQNRMLNATKPLIDYSTKLAKINSLKIDDLESLIALGGMYSPNDNLNTKYNENSFKMTGSSTNSLSTITTLGISTKETLQFDINRQELLECAFEALGMSALWAFSGSNLSTWTVKTATKAFSAAAGKFLGPLGVSIAVVSFGYCIYQHGND